MNEIGIANSVTASDGKSVNKVVRHLKWYERQWWSGFIAGAWAGSMVGVAGAFPLYLIAKAVVSVIQ